MRKIGEGEVIMKLADIYESVRVEVEELKKIGNSDNTKLYKKARELSKSIDDKLEDIYDEGKVDRDKEGHKLLRYIEEVQDIAAGRAFRTSIKLEDINLDYEV